MDSSPDVRWKQRFQNFDRAYVLLREAMENGPDALSQLEKEGTIQRFEFCFELAWKTVQDYMDEAGFIFATVTPRQVIKDAFAAKIVSNGQVWIDMLHHRNKLSHTYNRSSFEEAIRAIDASYLAALGDLHEFFQTEFFK